MESNNFFDNDDHMTEEWVGEIVDINDPNNWGRCKIRIYGKYDDIKDENLPWALPETNSAFSAANGGSGEFSTPKKGSKVRVRFFMGNHYQPVYSWIPRPNTAMIEKIKDSYEGAQVIRWDEDEKMRIWYTKKDGLNIELAGSQIIFNPDNSITIEHKDSDSLIELKGKNLNIVSKSNIDITAKTKINMESNKINVNGKKVDVGANPNYSATLSEPLWAFLKSLAAVVDAKLPISPGVNSGLAVTAEQASTSKTVKVSM